MKFALNSGFFKETKRIHPSEQAVWLKCLSLQQEHTVPRIEALNNQLRFTTLLNRNTVQL